MTNFNDRIIGFLNHLNARMTPKKRVKPEGPPYADLYARAMAAAADFAVIFFLLSGVFRKLTMMFYRHVDGDLLAQAQQAKTHSEMLDLLWQSQLPQWWMVNAAIQIFVIGVLLVGSQCVWGTTPGKWLMGLRVVTYPSLEKPARWRYVLRFLAYVPSAGFAMIGVFWMSFNRQHRAWHDYIAGTAVLSERPARWYWNKAKLLYRRLHPAAIEETVGEPPAKEGQ